MKRTLLFSLVLVILLTGCSTLFVKGGSDYRQGEGLYKEGKYDEAAAQAITALEKNPEFPEASELLDKSVKAGTEGTLAKIEKLEQSDDPFIYDRIWKLYALMDRVHKVIVDSGYGNKYETRSYAEEVKEAKTKAAEAYYAAGKKQLEEGTFRSARKAAVQFHKVRRLISEYKDTEALLEQAMDASVATALVYSVDGKPELEAKVVEAARQDKGVSNLTEFTTSEEAGLTGGLSSSDLLSRMGDSADFILFIGNVEYEQNKTPFDVSDGEMIDGIIKTRKMSVSYTNTGSVSFSLYETTNAKNGEELATDTVKVSEGDSIEYRIMKSSGMKELNIGSGNNNYVILKLNENIIRDFRAMQQYVEDTKKVVENYSEGEIKSIEDFSELKELVDGKIFNYDANLYEYPQDSGYARIYYEDDDTANKNMKTKVTSMFGSHIPSAMKQVLANATEESGNLKLQLMDKIGTAVTSHLK